MSLGQIEDMNVVANTGAVRGGVVGAEDLDPRAPVLRYLQHTGDEVGLRPMILPRTPVGSAPAALK